MKTYTFPIKFQHETEVFAYLFDVLGDLPVGTLVGESDPAVEGYYNVHLPSATTTVDMACAVQDALSGTNAALGWVDAADEVRA